jgi:nitroreductase
MEFAEVVRRRRMTRNFLDEPLPGGALDRILEAGRRAPTAGFAQGVEFLVLEDRAARQRYWHITFPPEHRDAYPWPGLFNAAVVVIPLGDPTAYLERYREPDKAATGLGESADVWPVPYWLTDAAMAAENMLLAAIDESLGALFFGIFWEEAAAMAAFDVPAAKKPIGAIAIGRRAEDRASRSLARPRRPVGEIAHLNRW